jgi:branched-chain amino acid transport system substrate-binding protein
MKQASAIRDLEIDMLLPDIRINTSPDNLAPISQSQLQVFEGDRWRLLGPVYQGHDSGQN